jgi:hypothetical protein
VFWVLVPGVVMVMVNWMRCGGGCFWLRLNGSGLVRSATARAQVCGWRAGRGYISASRRVWIEARDRDH